jgi:hypothetical protein
LSLLYKVPVVDITAILNSVQRKYPFLDFWSDPEDKITIAGAAANLVFPDIVVGNLPATFTPRKVVLVLAARALFDTSGADNYIDQANKTLRIKKDTGNWGADDIVAITFDIDSLYTRANAKEPGPCIIGDTDLQGEVDGNATYNIRSDQTVRGDAISALANNLEMYDVQVGLRYFYS